MYSIDIVLDPATLFIPDAGSGDASANKLLSIAKRDQTGPAAKAIAAALSRGVPWTCLGWSDLPISLISMYEELTISSNAIRWLNCS